MSTTLKRVLASLAIILFFVFALYRALPMILGLAANPLFLIVAVIIILSLVYGLVKLVLSIE